MENKVNLDKLTKSQLIGIILNQSQINTRTELRVSDIVISANESLQTCEETLNRILERNKTFFENKKLQRQNFLVEKLYGGFDD